MKKIIILSIFLFLSLFLFSQDIINKKNIYRDYGIWSNEINSVTKASIHVFVKRINLQENLFKYSQRSYDTIIQQQSQITNSFRYRYELMIESKSTIYLKNAGIWLHGCKIFIDGEEVTKEQFPEGLTIFVSTIPTRVYFYNTNKEKINFNIKWEHADIDITE